MVLKCGGVPCRKVAPVLRIETGGDGGLNGSHFAEQDFIVEWLMYIRMEKTRSFMSRTYGEKYLRCMTVPGSQRRTYLNTYGTF